MASGRPSLRTLVFIGGAVLMLVPALVAGTVYSGALQRRAESMLAERLKSRGELSANLLARRLHQLWQEVETLSKTVDPDNLTSTREQLTFISQLDKRYSWLGVTNVEGRVLASTSGMLEGASVAQRPWFRRGLSGPTAIDVHEAKLLERLLPPTSEPHRFIDLAAPLTRMGLTEGVIGAHIDWRWMVESLRSLETTGIEILLLSRDGVVLFGPPDLLNKPLTIGSAQAANRVTTALNDERWPDGRDYVTAIVPTIGYENLPSFGWSLLVRQDVKSALGPTRELVRSFWTILGVGAAVALALLFAGAQWITTPLSRLSRSVEELISDQPARAFYRESRYDEASRLSSALSRVQSRLRSE